MCQVLKYTKRREKNERKKQNRYGNNSKTNFAPIRVKWRLNSWIQIYRLLEL